MSRELRRHADRDYQRWRWMRERDRRAEAPVTAAESGVRRRWMCWACARRWVATVRHAQCPFCRQDAVEERV